MTATNSNDPNDPNDPRTGDYLWDPKAPAVDDVAALERKLAPLSAANNPSAAPSLERVDVRPGTRPRARALSIGASIAASLAVAAAVALVVRARAPEDVVLVDGVDGSARRALKVGERFSSGEREAVIELGDHGMVTLAPGSVLSVQRNERAGQELALDKGALSAVVVAPPRFFTVTTPSTRAVDMGCAYDLVVDDAGATTLTVTSGFVALELDEDRDRDRDRQELNVLVPAGASARALPGKPPGLPFRSDAPDELRAVLDAHAHGTLDVDALLSLVDARDAITLWYAMRRIEGQQQERVRERLIQIAPPSSPDATVESIRAGDVNALYAWLDEIERALPTSSPLKSQ